MRDMTRRIVLLLLIAWLSVSFLHASRQPNRQPDTTANKPGNPSAIQLTPAPALTSTTQTEGRGAGPNAEKPKTNRQRFYGWLWEWTEPQNFANLLLVVAAVLAFIIGLVTLNAIQTQNRINLANVKIGRMSATAAKTSANVARDALVTTQRAFLLLDNIESVPVETRAGGRAGVRFCVEWINSGATPAIDARTGVSLFHFKPDEPIRVDFGFLERDVAADADVAFAGPHGRKLLATAAMVPMSELIQVAQGRLVLILTAIVVYRDTFPDTPLRRTHLCARIVVEGDPEVDHRPNIEFKAFGDHNRAE
jgi:hypothetical protein